MSAPRVGYHVRIRESHLSTVRSFFGEHFASEQTFTVIAIEPKEYRGGRAAIHIVQGAEANPNAARVLMVWPSQVTAFPRCQLCNEEGHTKTSATAKNCKERAKELAEKRAGAGL